MRQTPKPDHDITIHWFVPPRIALVEVHEWRLWLVMLDWDIR